MSSTSSLAIRRRISLLDMDRLHSPYSWPKSGRHQRVRDFTTESTATKEVRHAKTLRLKLLTSRDEDDEAEDSKAAEKILEDDAESLSDDDMSYGQDSNDRQIRDTQSKDTQLHDRIWSAMAPFESDTPSVRGNKFSYRYTRIKGDSAIERPRSSQLSTNHPQEGDLFINVHRTGIQVFSYAGKKHWVEIEQQHSHPTRPDYALGTHDKYLPTWVTRRSASTYRWSEKSRAKSEPKTPRSIRRIAPEDAVDDEDDEDITWTKTKQGASTKREGKPRGSRARARATPADTEMEE